MSNASRIVVWLCAIAGPALAGQVTPAKMTATAQMQMAEGALDGCGLRVVAIAQDGGPIVTAFDFSFNIYRSGISAVKAGARIAHMNVPKEVESPPTRPIASFWLRTPGNPATAPGKGGVRPSDSPRGYLLYVTTSESVSALFGAAFEGRQIQVGFRLRDEDSDRILTGSIQDSSPALKEVSQCLGELTEAMEKDFKETRPAAK